MNNPKADDLLAPKLAEINDQLSAASNGARKIDEVVVMQLPESNGEMTMIYQHPHDCNVGIHQLWELLQAFWKNNDGKQTNTLFSLPDREGNEFDFFVYMKIGETEYYAFANDADGTSSDLDAIDAWKNGLRAEFILLLNQLIMLLHNEQLAVS